MQAAGRETAGKQLTHMKRDSWRPAAANFCPSWYLQSFSGSKLHPNLEPDKLGGWSGTHAGVIGIHNYVVQLYTVLDNIQFSFFLNSTSIKLSFGKIYV